MRINKERMSQQNNIILLALFLLSIPCSSLGVTIETLNVNGFTVELIDTQRGSTIDVQYEVAVGSRLDPIPVAGRAHALEHMMFKGSLRHPGEETLDREVARIGGYANAFTGDSDTRYIMTAPQQYAEKVIDLIFAGLAGPEFTERSFKSEMAVVNNEVNGSYSKSLNEALIYGPQRELLPQGHSEKVYIIGDRTTLTSMTLDHMKNLFYGNYTPEFVRVVVTGNFSEGGIEKSQVRQWLEKYLVSASVENDRTDFKLTEEPAAKRRMQSWFSEGSVGHKFLELKNNEDLRSSVHQFELAKPSEEIDRRALMLLHDYLSLDFSGSFLTQMKERGLITSMHIWTGRGGGRALFSVAFNYTEEGWKRRSEILRAFHQMLGDIRESGLSDLTMEVLNGRYKSMYTREYKKVSEAGAIHLDFKDAGFGQGPEDIERAFSKEHGVKAPDIQRLIAENFNPTKGLHSYTSPEIKGEMAATWHREMRVVEAPEEVGRWKFAYESETPEGRKYRPRIPEIPNFDKYRAPRGIASDSTEWKRLKGPGRVAEVWLKEDHSERRGYVIAATDLVFGDTDLELNTLRLHVAAFENRIVEVLSVLYAKGFSVGFDVQPYRGGHRHSLVWNLGGPSNTLLPVMNYLTRMFSEYSPSRDELERARVQTVNDLAEQISPRFLGGHIFNEAYRDLIDGHGPQQRIDILEGLDLTKHGETLRRIRIKGAPSVFAHGDLFANQVSSMELAMWNSARFAFPYGATTTIPEAPVSFSGESVVRPLPPGVDSNSVGSARVFTGPLVSNALETEAFSLLVNFVLSDQVYKINREQRGLGYIQSASAKAYAGRLYAFFFGQTEGRENRELMLEGFSRAINALHQGEITKETLAEYIRARVDKFHVASDSLETEVMRYMQYRGDSEKSVFAARAETLEASERMTPDDLIRVSEKYLLPQLGQLSYRQVETRDFSIESLTCKAFL